MTTTKRKRKSWQEYNVAWISALPIERASASEMLDEVHEEPEDFVRNGTDNNVYIWGRMHKHDIVVTSLPSHGYGKVNAAHTVVELLSSLPHIKFGLLVGIGAGLPSDKHDIRLGDVVVSQPNGFNGGVVQYDLGKATADGTWERVGCLNAPPTVLLRALSTLQAEHESGRFLMAEYLSVAMERNRHWGARFCYPVGKEDRSLRSGRSSDDQGIEEELIRTPRTSTEPHVHYGTIASGDMLVKNAKMRNDILERIKQTCLCIEMEAAGLMQKFPCIVIRGISDYADSKKNDDWQRYASATAAAFAKELLSYTPVVEVGQTRNAADIMDLKKAVVLLNENMADTQKELKTQKISEFLQALYTCPYADRKDRNMEALDRTCKWFTQHPLFLNWLHNPSARLLWVSADPGCGKSVLTKHLVDKVLNPDKDKTVCYFFFKDDFTDQNRCSFAMSAVLRQLFLQKPALLDQQILGNYNSTGGKYTESFSGLWNDFVKAASSDPSASVVCVFDALDECHKGDRRSLITAMISWHRQNPVANLKFLITSRPYLDIKDEFHNLLVHYPKIHLSGDSEEEAGQISKEIDIVIKHRIRLLCQKRSLTAREEAYLIHKFMEVPHRTYLWAHLTLDIVESTPHLTTASIKEVLANLPKSVEEAYEKILDRSLDFEKTRLLLHLLLAAQRPLSVAEMSLAMALTAEQVDSSEFDDMVEPAERFKHSIRDFCGLFVVVLDHHVYLLHQTAREFLLKRSPSSDSTIYRSNIVQNHSGWVKSFSLYESHCTLAERCLWYLFTTRPSTYNPIFFDYCNRFWVLHFTQADFEPGSPQVDMALSIFRSWSNNYWDLPEAIHTLHNLQGCLYERYCPIPTIYFPAWFGCTSVVRTMIETQLCRDSGIQVMQTALWLAVQAGHVDVVKLLTSQGLSVNTAPQPTKEDRFCKPIFCAINNKDKAMLRVLLKHDVELNAATGTQYSLPLHVASGLIQQQNPRPFIPFVETYRVSQLCNREIIELLIHAGADPAHRAINGATPLHTFLEHYQGLCSDPAESLRILNLLFLPGVDINKTCSMTGANYLKFAALGGCTICIELLKKRGASTDLQDSFGNTILHDIASSQGDPSCIQLASRMGIAIDCRNSAGQTPLMFAAMFGRDRLALELLNLGADISAYDIDGWTPLMFSAIEGSDYKYPIANHRTKNLLAREFLVKATPLHKTYLPRPINYSFMNAGHMTRFLLQRGADVHTKDTKGRTCLHLTAYAGKKIVLEIIINAGANVNELDAYGQKPLDVLAPWLCDLASLRSMQKLLTKN